MGYKFNLNNSLTGTRKTFDDALDEASAYLLRNTYPTYSKVPPIIQSLRVLPLGLTGIFGFVLKSISVYSILASIIDALLISFLIIVILIYFLINI